MSTTVPRRGPGENQRALQDAIKRLIVERGLASGSPLPPEPELMAELSVSRHPLREAIKALQALGIVDIRHGRGTYVGTPSFAPLEAGLTFHTDLSLRGDLADIRNLVQIREVLEIGLVRRVLALADQTDLAALERAVAGMEAEAARGRYAPDADWLFHMTLYQPLDNVLISDLLRVFWGVFDKVNTQLPRTTETPALVAALHRDILHTLRSRDQSAMTDAVVAHFKGINGRISRALAPTPTPPRS